MKVKINNNLKLYNPPDNIIEWIEKEFKILNPKWLENDKMGRWNGKTDKHLLFYKKDKSVYSIPIGAGIEMHYKCILAPEYHDQRIDHPIKIEFKGELRDFQKEAVTAVATTGTIEAPTGAGKTIMGIAHICDIKQKTLILVHTKELAYQWIDRITKFTNLDEFEVGLIGDGSYHIGNEITIGMVQSCYKKVNTLSDKFGMVITDEAHRAPSRTFINILSKLQCKYRLGLTATPYRRDKLNQLIKWYCGPIVHRVSRSKLIDSGDILQPQFVMKYTNFVPMCDPVNEYSKMISELTNDEYRNKQIAMDIVRLCRDPNINCLVISDRKYHCHLLSNYIYNYGSIEHHVLTGDTPKEERKDIIQSIGKNTNLLIATGQLIGEGFDCKNLNALFITTPIRFAGRVTQYIGRIMRSAPGKDRPIVIDYIDFNVPTLERSAMARTKIYGKGNVIYDGQIKQRQSSGSIKGKVRTKKR